MICILRPEKRDPKTSIDYECVHFLGSGFLGVP
ncbi:MAG: hypothetical protein G01um101416_1084 [Microgenomates group bacterium Gr01-1014_16]|nr:MAG: hypothetical protein G01um101416_1084 [Microgenomates group bacterium Gr01-1014_16]